jgi:hypothetical protein
MKDSCYLISIKGLYSQNEKRMSLVRAGSDIRSSNFLVISTLSDYAQARHTRREAGIQYHGW